MEAHGAIIGLDGGRSRREERSTVALDGQAASFAWHSPVTFFASHSPAENREDQNLENF
jgi:hypothetical protein